MTDQSHNDRAKLIINGHCDRHIYCMNVISSPDEVELYWDLTIQTDMTVAHNRPDTLTNKIKNDTQMTPQATTLENIIPRS